MRLNHQEFIPDDVTRLIQMRYKGKNHESLAGRTPDLHC
jgi:hypothetical protein